MNEAETRVEAITPGLRGTGWGAEPQRGGMVLWSRFHVAPTGLKKKTILVRPYSHVAPTELASEHPRSGEFKAEATCKACLQVQTERPRTLEATP